MKIFNENITILTQTLISIAYDYIEIGCSIEAIKLFEICYSYNRNDMELCCTIIQEKLILEQYSDPDKYIKILKKYCIDHNMDNTPLLLEYYFFKSSSYLRLKEMKKAKRNIDKGIQLARICKKSSFKSSSDSLGLFY